MPTVRISRQQFACFAIVAVLILQSVFSLAFASDDGEELIASVRRVLRIPANYTAELGPIEKTDIPGLVRRTLTVTGGPKVRSDVIFLSEDGRYLLWGRLYDMNVLTAPNRLEDIPIEGHPSFGPADAKITVVEYSDFQCPFCERSYWVVRHKLLRRYAGKIRMIYKDFPLTRIHPWAMKAAVGAQCAFQQGNKSFWKMHDLMFEYQDEISAENIQTKLADFAVEIGLDLETFQVCYETDATLPRVKASLAEAESLGLTGTPAFIVNGHLLRGAQPFSAFKAIIDHELKEVNESAD